MAGGTRSEFRKDFDYSRRFLDNLKWVVGQYLVGEAPWEKDAHENTDLVILGTGNADPLRSVHSLFVQPQQGNLPSNGIYPPHGHVWEASSRWRSRPRL